MASRSSVAINTAKARKLAGIEGTHRANDEVAIGYMFGDTSKYSTAYQYEVDANDNIDILKRGIERLGRCLVYRTGINTLTIELEFTGTIFNIVSNGNEYKVGDRVVKHLAEAIDVVRKSIYCRL